MSRSCRPQKPKRKTKQKPERWVDAVEYQPDADSARLEAVTERQMIRPREAIWPDRGRLQQPVDFDHDKQFLRALLLSYFYYLEFIYHTHLSTRAKMSETLQELADIPKDFLRDGSQFIRRCTKPDKDEFYKISYAVGCGFLVMGAIGYFVKLIHIPVNQVLVGGA
ncbi:hypothetical protein N7474_005473 [Penicillium riverlandense]|uniref:uncharacterized protein n=1 Tax=Penicillium riverlandense TaxID=1903569 RepID=UPI00254869B8|nr:uncharacterized protein N7474_005473 [Penicillium riverlandense]KAJ5819882.1 hypothetical protein N7474_005473 [Penicillium riverlandense]